MSDNKLVFVSYAHKDRDFLDKEVRPFLDQLELGEQIALRDEYAERAIAEALANRRRTKDARAKAKDVGCEV